MTEAASGAGNGHNATVKVENNVGALSEALRHAQEEAEASLPRLRIAAAETRVAKARRALAGAEAALAQARKEND